MIVKRFIAPSVTEALIQVRRELGEDAVILKTRKVEKGGLLSFLGKEMVEVSAATPDPNPAQPTLFDAAKSRFEHVLEEREQSAGAAVAAPGRALARGMNRGDGHTPEIEGIQTELTDLRATVRELTDHLKYRNAPSLPAKLAQRWRALVDNGVSERRAHDFLQRINLELSGSELDDEELIDEHLRRSIGSCLRTGHIPLIPNQGRALTIALIGPTGVGKTTTLAKLATNRRIFGKKRVALISTDTYRIAAVEQLQTFASIAGVEMEVVYRPEELPNAIDRHRDKDVVLIDTAGRSQSDSGALLELREFVEAAQPDEVLYVLSAGTRVEDQRDMIARYGQIPSTRMVLTKIDEISSAGHLLDVAELLPRQWVFLTVGQNVPDDIISADVDILSRMIASREYLDEYRRRGFTLKNDAR